MPTAHWVRAVQNYAKILKKFGPKHSRGDLVWVPRSTERLGSLGDRKQDPYLKSKAQQILSISPRNRWGPPAPQLPALLRGQGFPCQRPFRILERLGSVLQHTDDAGGPVERAGPPSHLAAIVQDMYPPDASNPSCQLSCFGTVPSATKNSHCPVDSGCSVQAFVNPQLFQLRSL